MDKYLNRKEAGRALANELNAYANRDDVIVLALPRGGVPVGYEIATLLNVPLDVYIVRKLGVPGHKELAMGAMALGDVCVFNKEIIHSLQISQEEVQSVIENEKKELKRREGAYRGDYPLPSLKEKTIILVDDGIATGASMRAAVKSLRALQPASIIVAVPVADRTICAEMKMIADKLICPLQPTDLYAVGVWYVDFTQTEDDEVRELLKKARLK
jgi:putative phosphoribosyl transferase